MKDEEQNVNDIGLPYGDNGLSGNMPVKSLSLGSKTVSLADFPEGEVLRYAQKIALRRMKRLSNALTSPDVVRRYLQTLLGACSDEVFVILLLDAKHRVIETVPLSVGTVDGAAVYPRSVIRHVLRTNAHSIICCHQHPSGNDMQSSADEAITTKIKQALSAIDVVLLDHLVVTPESITSFAEKGLL